MRMLTTRWNSCSRLTDACTTTPTGTISNSRSSALRASEERPHGLRYSFTLHGPVGRRLLGFDNAHGVAPLGSKYRKRAGSVDHWHRTESDEGRPYTFESAEKLLDDFQREVERVLRERRIPLAVTETEDRSGS